MIITKIRKKGFEYQIYLDGEYGFTLTDEGLYKAKLKSNTEFVADEQMNEIIKEDEVKRCKNRALRIITNSTKSAKKMREKLTQEEYSQTAIDAALEFLKSYQFMDDNRLAASLVKKATKQGSSIRQIKNNLYNKGIQKEDMLLAIEKVDEVAELENAKKMALKKYNSIKNKPSEEIIRKVYYTLNYKGFSYPAISKAMDEIKELLKTKEEFF